MSSPRRLIVMRHAKAEPFAATDHARVLTERGRRAAREAGRHLAAIEAVPDHALVSTAARAVQTWEQVVAESGSQAEAQLDGAVYAGSVDVVLEALRVSPVTARTVIFIGHNPSASYLAHVLDDGSGDLAATQAMLQGFPAAAMALLEVPSPWSELAEESARLTHFHVGKG